MPEFVRGLRHFCVTVGSGLYVKAYMDTFYPIFSEMAKPYHRVDWWKAKVPDRYSEAPKVSDKDTGLWYRDFGTEVHPLYWR